MTSLVDLTGSPVPGVSRGLTGRLARPAGEGPWPGVVVVFEVLGINDVALRQAERLADAGYLALMPDLYSEGGPRRCMVPTIRTMVTGAGRAYQDLAAARDWLTSAPECTGRIGVIGFCLGGGFALMCANRGYDAAAANYGMLPRDLDSAFAGACPVVTSYGGRDPVLRGATPRLEAALQRAGVPHDCREYPRASHSFMNDDEAGPAWLRPALRVTGIGPEPTSAADAWRRIETFFDQYLR